MFPQESLRQKLGPPISVQELAWFNHERYSRAVELGVLGWERALDARSVVLHFGEARIFLKSDSTLDGLLVSPVDQFLVQQELFDDPFAVPISDSSLDSLLFDVVAVEIDKSRLPSGEISGGWHSAANEVSRNLISQIEKRTTWFHSASGPMLESVPLLGSVRELLATPKDVPETLPIDVCIGTDDETLVQAFRDWLAGVRTEFGPVSAPRTWSSASMDGWINARVLQYLDIKAFCLFKGCHVTQAVMGRVLFPDEYEVDLAERCRKVVAPLAERLMSEEFLNTLGAHNRWRNKK